MNATEIEIPVQQPQAPPLEQWDIDPPRIKVELSEPAWVFKGKFDNGKLKLPWGEQLKFKEARAAGAEATLTFDGTGVAIVGRCTQEGGRADVFLDGEKVGEVDAWIPKNTSDNDYWHVSGLSGGKHSVRIVVRSDADARSPARRYRLCGPSFTGQLQAALRAAISPGQTSGSGACRPRLKPGSRFQVGPTRQSRYRPARQSLL